MRLLCVLSLVVILTACQNANVPRTILPSAEYTRERVENAELNVNKNYFEGQINVALRDPAELNGFVQQVFKETGVALQLLDEVDGRPIYLFEYRSEWKPEDLAVKLRERPEVLRAAPNHYLSVNAFNDPDFKRQWSMLNQGQEAPGALAGRRGAHAELPLEDIEPKADVVVAIVDTGIDYLHKDLSVVEDIGGKPHVVGGNLWQNPGEVPANGKNDDNNGGEGVGYIDDVFGFDFVGKSGDPMDDHGHGTHIAGVIGGLRNNFEGIAGINKSVKMMAVRFLGASGGGSDFGAVQAIDYVVKMKKRFPDKKFLMNCSWGGSGRIAPNDDQDFLMAAFQEAADADILTIAAAGNSALSTRFSEFYPANYSVKIPQVVSVAATNNVDQLADFSNFGEDYVQIAAPGVLIYSTLPGDRYEAWSGTSMAAPHVAGAAALVWSQNPEMTALDVRNRLIDTADILPQFSGLVGSNGRGGRLNIARAVKGDMNVFPAVEPVVETVPHIFESPRISGVLTLDHVATFEAPGAKSVQVCFSEFKLDDSIDWIQVYGQDYRVRDIITGTRISRRLRSGGEDELCAAAVPGEKAFVRLYSSPPFLMLTQGIEPQRGYTTSKLKVIR